MEDYKFKFGEHFELYYKNTDHCQICQVELVLDEMVQYKVLNYQNENGQYQNGLQWLTKETNKIQPAGTYRTQYRVRLVEIFEQNHEKANQMRQGGGDGDMEMAGDRGGAGRHP